MTEKRHVTVPKDTRAYMDFPKKIDTVKSKLLILWFDRPGLAFGNPV